MPNLCVIEFKKNIATIASETLHIDNLIKEFSAKENFKVIDIMAYYQKFGNDVKRATVYWRIYDLVNRGILHRVSRGLYSLSESEGKEYIPEINKSLIYLSGKIYKQFPFIDFCIWSTKWLNEFMLHQPFRFYNIVEVEKEVMESVFYALKEQGKEVFLDPSEDIINNYVVNASEPIIITRLTTEAPTQKVNKVVTQTIEKLLVDIYCDPIIFAAQQGAELKWIYKAVLDKYNVNKPKMLRYASRRNKRDEIESFRELINR
ncbi:DUF6577 family protein [Gelidibacter mesophilus]|uniref:DUF6577 family protein n=1 Tax=Gelidibacter mesophilus TaxID=169050 RepID=UPI001FDEB99C|nr:DUF6577 family protein [Gelidibacter mesophilus]